MAMPRDPHTGSLIDATKYLGTSFERIVLDEADIINGSITASTISAGAIPTTPMPAGILSGASKFSSGGAVAGLAYPIVVMHEGKPFGVLKECMVQGDRLVRSGIGGDAPVSDRISKFDPDYRMSLNIPRGALEHCRSNLEVRQTVLEQMGLPDAVARLMMDVLNRSGRIGNVRAEIYSDMFINEGEVRCKLTFPAVVLGRTSDIGTLILVGLLTVDHD